MKNLYVILFILPLIGFSQNINPKIGQSYTTSSLGYSGCKDEATLHKILQASVRLDNDTFMKHHDSGDCIVVPGNMEVTVVDIVFEGNIVELRTPGVKSTLWTVREVLKASRK